MKMATCKNCSHVWKRRTPDPERCPNCQSTRWKEGNEPDAECVECGHVWVTRTDGDPQMCPKCHSHDWKGEK